MFEYPWGTSEDDLTRSFFGLMKYLPGDALLVPFLSLIQSHYPDRNIVSRNIESAEILLWPEYEIPKEWREQFNSPDVPTDKRRSKYYIIPDVVIRFADCVFIVEAEKSHSVEPEQLFQQYLIGRRIFFTQEDRKRRLFNLLINTDHMPPYSCSTTPADRESGISISPSDSIPRYIEKRAKMIGEACDLKEISQSFLWISWHHIGELAEDVLGICGGKQDEFSQTISRFLTGFKEMMDREGFYPVRVFRADHPTEYKNLIEPSLIPAFKILGYMANWLTKQIIDPDVITILTKEGTYGNR